jgi:hypothetical protein
MDRHPRRKIVRDADVKHAASTIGENVDEEKLVHGKAKRQWFSEED